MDELGLLRIDGRLKNLNAPLDTVTICNVFSVQPLSIDRLTIDRLTIDLLEGAAGSAEKRQLLTLQWPLGRTVETINGLDGRIRVVVVRTATTGDYKRAITKVAVFPIDSGDEDRIKSGYFGLVAI